MFTPRTELKKDHAIIDEHTTITVSADTVRSYFDGKVELEELDTALDSAQGEVFSGAESEVYVIIKITN